MGRDMGKDFTKLHWAMIVAVDAQDAAGRTSPEVERLTTRVLMGLWVCANNDPVPKVTLDGLAEDMAALEKAHDEGA